MSKNWRKKKQKKNVSKKYKQKCRGKQNILTTWAAEKHESDGPFNLHAVQTGRRCSGDAQIPEQPLLSASALSLWLSRTFFTLICTSAPERCQLNKPALLILQLRLRSDRLAVFLRPEPRRLHSFLSCKINKKNLETRGTPGDGAGAPG